ncbi:MAG: HAD family hydrolase [Planctomycetota bacterium]|nr:MAG: HAD family hydrolase [Planctomycetota bacterium]
MSTVKISAIHVVVFDLDDTLYPERSFAYSGFDAVADWLRKQIKCPTEPAKRMREIFETQDRAHVFDRLMNEWGCRQTAQMVAGMIEVYRLHTPDIKLYDDAHTILTEWSGRFPLALISDGLAHVQQRKIDALGLAERLDAVILTDRWGKEFWKPHPRAFREVEKIWGYRARSCLYIADNAEKDFQAPRKLGWQTIRIRRPDGIYAKIASQIGSKPDYQITSLSQIDLTS